MGEVLRVLQGLEEAQAVLNPLRLQILEHLESPGSASSLAPDLGTPRQLVNYHLRELEKAGLVELVEERRRGSCVERLYRSSARSYVFAPQIGRLKADPDQVQDRLSSEYLVAVGARLIDDVAELRADATRRVPILALDTEVGFASEEERNAFAADIAAAVATLARKYHNSDGESFRLIVVGHPALERAK